METPAPNARVAPDAKLLDAVQPIADAARTVAKDIPAETLAQIANISQASAKDAPSLINTAETLAATVEMTAKASLIKAPELEDKSAELTKMLQDTGILEKHKELASTRLVVRDSPLTATFISPDDNSIVMTSAAFNERTPDERKAAVLDQLGIKAAGSHHGKFVTRQIDDHVADLVPLDAMKHNFQLLEQDRNSTISAIGQALEPTLAAALEEGTKLYSGGTSVATAAERIENLNVQSAKKAAMAQGATLEH